MATTKRFEMTIMLSIVLLISSVANAADDGTCNLYDRRGLTENAAAGGKPAGGAPAGGAPAGGVPAGGAPAGGAPAGGGPIPPVAAVFDVSKCPNAKGDGKTDDTQVRIHILNLNSMCERFRD